MRTFKGGVHEVLLSLQYGGLFEITNHVFKNLQD